MGPVRTHTLSAEYTTDLPATIDATYGFDNWAAAKPYVDLVFNPWGAAYNAAVRAAGIATGAYIDVNFCSGSFAAGPNRYASPDCSSLPDDGFYAEPGFPDRPLTLSFNGAWIQKVGNPASTTLRAAAVAAVRSQLAAAGPLDVIEIDDANTPDEYYGQGMCWGIGRPAGSSYACSSAPGGSAAAPFAASYSRTQWQAGEAGLAAALPLPVVFNGLNGFSTTESEAAAVGPVTTVGNGWGGECDTCFYTQNVGSRTGAVLDHQLSSLMDVVSAGRNVILLNESVTDVAVRETAVADAMLVYDPDRLYVANQPCGTLSHIHACAEQGLTFYAPLRPYPSGPGALRAPGGTYVREFAACFDRGKPVGPCASVVNPDANASHAMPALTFAYRHTLQLHGSGPCACYGDTGSVAVDGPAPPATLPPAGAVVLFS
jgi:uncharacterized membrane protein